MYKVVVVWWCHVCLCKQGWRVLGQNDQNRATGAWLRVHHLEWPLVVTMEGDMVVPTRQWWCSGAASGCARGDGGFEATCPKPSRWGSVSGTLWPVGNGCRERWGDVVGWCVGGGGVVVVLRSVAQPGAAGLGAN